MKKLLALLLLLLSLGTSPVWAADFAVVQEALPTSGGGTVDFTSSGFGTPVCALFFGSYGTAAGTVVDHSMFSIGAFDGTRSFASAWVSEDNVVPDVGMVNDNNSAFITLLSTDQTQDADCTASWITDGVRLTCADAPPAAYLVNAVLMGGTGVANCRVDTAATPTTIDTATDVTAPGFQPDFVIAWAHNENTSVMRPSVGFVVRDGSDTQRSMNFSEGGANPSNVASVLSSEYVVRNGASSTSAAAQISGFDANGFDLYLRVLTGAAVNIRYVAVQLSGISASVATCASPTGIGDHTCTGAAATPQFGLMLQGEAAAVDTYYTADNGEVFGISAFTSGASGIASVFNEDNTNPGNTESVTDTKPVRLRKDAADFMTATFSAFTSTGAMFNYSVVDGAARQRAMLFVEAPVSSSGGIRRRNFK